MSVPVPPPPVMAGQEAGDAEREDQAEEAAAFYLLKRAPDGKNIPVERYLGARESAARMRIYSSARRTFVARLQRDSRISAFDPTQQSSTGGWVALGPGNIGGRTRALVINPNDPTIMYAGSTGGGVWKTMDAGASWTPLADLLPSIAIGSLAMDPTAPDTLYAGTGDPLGSVAHRGAGIFKTTDGGATWNQLPGTGTPDFYYVNKLAISPLNNNNVYAATETGIWFSPDGGATWTRTLDRSSPNSGCQDLAIRTDQSTDYIFATCGRNNAPPSAIFRNIDASGSGTWSQVFTATGMGRTSIALAPSNQSILYALSTSVDPKNPDFTYGLLGVYRSNSNGDPGSWQAVVTNADPNRTNASLLSYPNSSFADICGGGKATYGGQGWLDIIIVVDPLNPDRVWVGGIDLFRSDDGGKNWGIAMFWEARPPQRAHADNHLLVFHPGYNGADNQILYNTSDGGIFLTDNANADVATGDRAGCFPFQTKVNWKTLNNNYAVTQFHYGAPYPSGIWYWGGTQDNGTVRGSDGQGANSWTTVAGGDGGYVAVNPKDANVIYHEFTALSIAKSTDGGQNFRTSIKGITDTGGNFLFIPPFILDPTNPDRVYLGGQKLWRTNDAAANWSAASAAVPNSQGLISTIAVAPSDPNHMMFGTSTGQIFRNSAALNADETSVWDSNRPRAGFVAAIAFDPGNTDVAYVVYSTFKGGKDNYVYKTTDAGATWTGIDGTGDAGLPDAPVASIVVDPLNSASIYVGTDLGVFVSLDGGASWAREDAPYADVPVENLTLDRNAGLSNLFAVTQGRGVWRVSLPDSGTACQYSVSPNPLKLDAYGSQTSVNVATGDNCLWLAIPNTPGFQIQSPASGTGSGQVNISTIVNTATTSRTGSIFVQDKQVNLTQAGALVASGNDEVTGAQAISSTTYVGIQDTRKLTSNTADPVHSCTKSADFKTVWWKLVPGASGTLNVGVQGERYDVFGNSGVVLTVYDTQAAAGNELACIQHARDTRAWQMVSTLVPVTQGKTYLIEVSATGNTANDGGYTILAAALQ